MTDKGFTAHFNHLNSAIQFIYTTNVTSSKIVVNLDNIVYTTSDQLGIVKDGASIQVSGNGSATGYSSKETTTSESTTESITTTEPSKETITTELTIYKKSVEFSSYEKNIYLNHQSIMKK